MKSSFYLLPLLAVLWSATCHAQDAAKSTNASSNSSSSIHISDEKSVATIRGSSGVANIQGDKVELRNRTVYVNGVSYGAVLEVCEVKYVVTKTSRTLFVDGKARNPPAKK
jgi:hypothetical protein